MRSLELFWLCTILAKNLGDVLAGGLSIISPGSIIFIMSGGLGLFGTFWHKLADQSSLEDQDKQQIGVFVTSFTVKYSDRLVASSRVPMPEDAWDLSACHCGCVSSSCNLEDHDFKRTIFSTTSLNKAVTLSRSQLHIFHSHAWRDTCTK